MRWATPGKCWISWTTWHSRYRPACIVISSLPISLSEPGISERTWWTLALPVPIPLRMRNANKLRHWELLATHHRNNIRAMLTRALKNDINQRYQSAAAMKQDIYEILLNRFGLLGSPTYTLGTSGAMATVNPTNAPTIPNSPIITNQPTRVQQSPPPLQQPITPLPATAPPPPGPSWPPAQSVQQRPPSK